MRQAKLKSSADVHIWRIVSVFVVAGIIGASASLPYVSEQFLTNPKIRGAMPPLSLPVLQFLVVAQSVVHLAFMVPVGLALARRIGFGVPLVEAWTSGQRAPAAARAVGIGLLSGVAVGAVALLIESLVSFPRLPAPLRALDAGSVALWKRLLVGFLYGGIVEELFFRLFLNWDRLPDDGSGRKAALIADDKVRCTAWADNFKHGVPGARIVIIPNADHYLYLTNEAQVVSEINVFLASLH